MKASYENPAAVSRSGRVRKAIDGSEVHNLRSVQGEGFEPSGSSNIEVGASLTV